MNIEQKTIIKSAIETFGIDNQLDMVIEECAELIQALQKLKRAKYSIVLGEIPINKDVKDVLVYANLCSEVADVKIMIEQCEIILNKKTIDISVERKLLRLQDRVNLYNQKYK